MGVLGHVEKEQAHWDIAVLGKEADFALEIP